MKIGALGLTTNTRNVLVRLVEPELTVKACAEGAKRITVADVMAVIDKEPLWNTKNQTQKDNVPRQRLKSKLRELEMTTGDWPRIGTPTEAMECILQAAAECSKEQVGACNIRLLGQCTWLYLDLWERAFDKEITEITIGDLVASDPEAWPRSWDSAFSHHFGGPPSMNTLGLKSIREKLLRLGFKYEDGPFLQAATRRREIERIAKDLKVSKKKAGEIIDYLGTRGWGPLKIYY